MIFKVFLVILSVEAVSSKAKIGGIFYNDDTDSIKSFELSAKELDFDTYIKRVTKRGEIYELINYVCDLAETAIVGIVDGTGGRASEQIQAITDMMDLPHIMVQHNELHSKYWSALNLYPSDDSFNLVLGDLIRLKDWDNFTILYMKGHTVSRVSSLMEMAGQGNQPTITYRELNGNNYRDVLINAKQSKYTNFVVECPYKYLERLLLQLQQVGLMADEHSYIFVSSDLFTLDLDRYRFGGVNMTGLKIVNSTNNELLWNFTTKFNMEMGTNYNPEQINTKLLLIHDAVLVFAEALKKMADGVCKPQLLHCDNYEHWMFGSTVLNFMRTNEVKGITNTLLFDGLGQRINVNYEIVELTSAGNQTVGVWDPQNNQIKITRQFIPAPEVGDDVMRNKTFKVLIWTTPPHAYLKQSTEQLEGNDRYEGFSVDLIAKIAEILGFYYEFELESAYGEYDKSKGSWNGMVAKLMDERADFAICDFTITKKRQEVIDYSMPFMNLGIGILYKEPSKQPPAMFSFMEVFSSEVWYYMMFVQLGLGAIMIFVGRLSHKEWQNPDPCVEEPEELSNQFSFANSVWLIIGAVLQQGSEIAPIAVAPRLITSVWWFFTMVMVASYTGTLVAFLIVEKNVMPFTDALSLPGATGISYGAKQKGTTIEFFQNSPTQAYRTLYENMIKYNWVVADNDIGVQKAENTTYAFFMESTSIEYYKERHCDLLQVGELLDSKSYGIGMKKGSKYKKHIDAALLKLKEKGDILKLKNSWWKERRGGGNCETTPSGDPKQLGMKNMIGAFVVLGVGCCMGLLISTLDMLWGVFKRTVKYKTTFKFELIEELKFALKFSGDVKPVRRQSKVTGEGSAEALAEAEGKDELRSLHSIHSSDTRSTHHTHSSRHSSSDRSVMFARRRRYS